MAFIRTCTCVYTCITYLCTCIYVYLCTHTPAPDTPVQVADRLTGCWASEYLFSFPVSWACELAVLSPPCSLKGDTAVWNRLCLPQSEES